MNGLQKLDRKKLIQVFLVVLVFSLLAYSFLIRADNGSSSSENQSGVLKAAIVNQLSATQPNQEFVNESTSILTGADFKVDYYESDSVTVNFYRNLPKHGYDLIILRAHSGLETLGGQVSKTVCFFTSEPYSKTDHVSEQWSNAVSKGKPTVNPEEEEETYFVIRPKFVRSSMAEDFDNALIIMMGCDGLVYTKMAEAFMDKGALAYIGWNGLVEADYVDRATLHFLRGLIEEKETINDAVWDTREEIGPDPDHKDSNLVYYPESQENEKVRR